MTQVEETLGGALNGAGVTKAAQGATHSAEGSNVPDGKAIGDTVDTIDDTVRTVEDTVDSVHDTSGAVGGLLDPNR